MIRLLVAAIAFACSFSICHAQPAMIECGQLGCHTIKSAKLEQGVKVKTRVHRISNPMGRPKFRIVASADPRPRAWCGWWLRHYLGVADRTFNRALAWVHYGTPAHGPHIGAIVVWSHGNGGGHVGIITGRGLHGWIVKSGNDGHAVRERERSLAGAIAFRMPNGVAMR